MPLSIAHTLFGLNYIGSLLATPFSSMLSTTIPSNDFPPFFGITLSTRPIKSIELSGNNNSMAAYDRFMDVLAIDPTNDRGNFYAAFARLASFTQMPDPALKYLIESFGIDLPYDLLHNYQDIYVPMDPGGCMMLNSESLTDEYEYSMVTSEIDLKLDGGY